MKQGTVSTFIRKLKIAFRLLLVCALGYGVLLVVSIGSMYAMLVTDREYSVVP